MTTPNRITSRAADRLIALGMNHIASLVIDEVTDLHNRIITLQGALEFSKRRNAMLVGVNADILAGERPDKPTREVLSWDDLAQIGERADADRAWWPKQEHDLLAYFESETDQPDAQHPNRYARAAMTRKFALWLLTNRPTLAHNLGLQS